MSRDRGPRLQPTRKDAMRTRARLLEAAGEAFAARGFHDASLRKICEAAGVNLGAVKYYFGGKEALYRELLVDSHLEILSREEMPTLDNSPDAEHALARWIEWFLSVLLSRAQHPYLGRIMVREIVQPTEVLDDLVRNVFTRIRRELERIVATLSEDVLDKRSLGQVTNMTLMLCVMHEMGRPVIEKFGYEPPRRRVDVARLGDVVTRYAMGGIAASGDAAPRRSSANRARATQR